MQDWVAGCAAAPSLQLQPTRTHTVISLPAASFMNLAGVVRRGEGRAGVGELAGCSVETTALNREAMASTDKQWNAPQPRRLTSPRRASRGTPSGWPAQEEWNSHASGWSIVLDCACKPCPLHAQALHSQVKHSSTRSFTHFLELVVLGHHLHVMRAWGQQQA